MGNEKMCRFRVAGQKLLGETNVLWYYGQRGSPKKKFKTNNKMGQCAESSRGKKLFCHNSCVIITLLVSGHKQNKIRTRQEGKSRRQKQFHSSWIFRCFSENSFSISIIG